MFEFQVAFSVKAKSILAIVGQDGKTLEGQSLDPLKAQYPDLQIAYSAEAQRAIEETYLTLPVEVTESDYHQALGAVPPRLQRADAFICGELYYGAVGIFYVTRGKRFFKLRQRVTKPMGEVLAMVDEAIAQGLTLCTTESEA